MAMSILYLLKGSPLGAHHGKVLHNHGKAFLIEQEHMYSWSTRVDVFVFNKNTLFWLT